jgi:amphi-Trp domain-containing protein
MRRGASAGCLNYGAADWCTPSAVAARGARGGTEKAVSDVTVEQKESPSRQDAARFIAALAKGLADDGRVTVQLGSSTLQLSVAGQVDCELGVGVDGDEVELEFEVVGLGPLSRRLAAGR